VRSVFKGSVAEKAGVKAGDVIVKVEDSRVSTPREVSNAIRTARSRKSLPMVVMRDRKETTLTVNMEDERDTERERVTPRARAINRQL
jgi:serine protease Do